MREEVRMEQEEEVEREEEEERQQVVVGCSSDSVSHGVLLTP